MLGEPTNDLDIETLAALEDVLDGWAGTLVVVSHDRYLLERVCTEQVALLGDGRVRQLPGGVEEYLTLRAQAETSGSYAVRSPAASGAPEVPVSSESAAPTASAAEQREARKTLARVEKQLSRLDEREQRLHAAMAEQASDHGALRDLDTQLREVASEREVCELEWLDAAALLE